MPSKGWAHNLPTTFFYATHYVSRETLGVPNKRNATRLISDACSPDSVSCANGNKQEAGAPTPTPVLLNLLRWWKGLVLDSPDP